MKKNLLFFTVLLSLFCNLSANPNRFTTNYENINNVASFSNQVDYYYNLVNGMNLHYSGSFRKLDDCTWNRQSKQTSMSWFLNYKLLTYLNSTFHFDYDYHVDKSSFSNGPNYNLKSKQREFGTNLHYHLGYQDISGGISYLHNRQNDIQEQDSFYLSNGYENFVQYVYNSSKMGDKFRFKTFFEKTDLDFNWEEEFNTQLVWGISNNFEVDIDYTRINKNIYEFQENSDYLQKTISNVNFDINKNFLSFIDIKLYEKYIYNDYHYDEKVSKNYNKSDLQSDLTLNYSIWNFDIKNSAGLNLFTKNYFSSNRKIFMRTKETSNQIIMNFAQNDSIVFRTNLKLEQTFNPENNHYWDNDIASNLNQLSLFYHYKEAINLSTHIYYKRSKEVYISSEMSGKNKTKKTYKLQPILDIELTPYITLNQEYLLQANYDDYKWNEYYNDRYFRRLKADYFLEFTDISYFDFKLFYGYENNDSGENYENYYIKLNQAIIHKYEISIAYNYQKINMIFEPSLIKKNQKEIVAKSTLSYELSQNSYAGLRITPTYYESDRPFWRVDFWFDYTF
ncbi:MAG: hypothetical protein U9N34_06795 [Candidatus Cloacimonadota bacterium]|nr:hypothetical protein [Candidatus Cloacimonadota bacterium]